MDIQQLNYILTLSQTGSITRAAEKLYISQPTLSQFLSRQERELGAPLFQRSNGTYTVTPLGQLYAEYAKKVLALTEELELDMQKISTTSTIRIGTSSSRAMQMVSSIFIDFRKVYPNVELNLSDDNLRFMRNAITKGDLDMAFITADSLEDYKKQSMEIKKEEVVFAAPSIHPYCQTLQNSDMHTLTAEDLLKYFKESPFILQHEGSCIKKLIDSFLKEVYFKPIIACYTNHAQTICEMVSGNIGVGFIPIGYALNSPLITYFSLEPKISRIHSILYRKDLILEAPHKFLIQLALDYAKNAWTSF